MAADPDRRDRVSRGAAVRPVHDDHCDRATGERGKEPLATPATCRRDGNSVLFGQNLMHAETGELRLGDEVTALEAV
jgi:uncharacterized protein YcbX